ncbi:hypothetical protein [Brucella intermedia]|uniref:hypothetical protein n=1 Tax=Brucella intermedia TaxID=94625 RepID=UPI001590B167|nr:hypothetical protein [Brucella intermedia]
MAQPLPYERDFDFAGFQSTHPSTPLPGDKVNLELDQIAYTTDEIRERIRILQRDDLQLANQSVGWDQLKPELRNGFSTPTVWATGVDYSLGAAVYVGRKVYAALVAHKSANFGVDLAAGKWYLLADFTAVTQVDQTAVEAAQQAIAAATAAQGSALAAAQTVAQSAANAQAAQNSATDAAASQSAAAGFATAANASAISASQSAANASAAASAAVAAAIGVSVQAYSPNLTELSSVDPGTAGKEILALANAGDVAAYVGRYGTRADVAAANVPAHVQTITTAGYAAVGDGGGALYKRVSAPTLLGKDIITNGGFSADTSWVKGTGWTISGGTANKAVTASQSELGQTRTLVAGFLYAITYTISNYSGSGWVRPYFGYNGTIVIGTQRTANGTYTDYITAAPLNGRVVFQAQATVACSLDNVVVRPVMGAIQSADGAWWEIVLSDELDIRPFGGRLNDDAFDNGPILEQVLKLGTVKIPGNATLSCLSSVDISNTNVCIVGKSQSTSHLKFVGSVNGFTGTHGLPDPGKPMPILILDNMALVTTNDPAVTQNTAINVTYPEGFFAARSMLYGAFHRCAFRGLNTELNGWGTVLSADNALNYYFSDCSFNGKDEGGAADQDPAKKKRSLYAVRASGGWVPCEFHFTNCQFYHFNDSIFTTGSFEGLYLTDCALVSVGTGVRQLATTFSPNWPGAGGVPISAVGRPWITVKGSHFNVYDRAIYSFGVVQGGINGNSFYQSDNARANVTLVQMESGHDWDIGGNVFRSYSASYLANGVVVGSGAGRVNIHDNNFETKGVGIWLQPGGTGGNRESANEFKGTFATSSIYNELNEDAVVHGHRSLRLFRTNPQSIPNYSGSAVLISWDTKEHSTIGFTSGTNIVIPAYSGIRRVIVTVGVIWDANATGQRNIEIRVNGVAKAMEIKPAMTGGANTTHCLTSGPITVAETDVITVAVIQTSGGALNVQGSQNSWVSLEVVE